MPPHSEVKPALLCIVGLLMVYSTFNFKNSDRLWTCCSSLQNMWYILHLETIIIENTQSELLKIFDPFHLTSND